MVTVKRRCYKNMPLKNGDRASQETIDENYKVCYETSIMKIASCMIILIIPLFLALASADSVHAATTIGTVPAPTTSATLALAPATGSYASGNAFAVAISLDTKGESVQGTDVFLSYDPLLLAVIDDNAATTGTQIAAGSLMTTTAANSVDTAAGTITFSQTTNGNTVFTGIGTLATIHFTARAAGTAAVTFTFTLHSTTDTNVSRAGVDILASITNGSYTITQPPPPDTQAPSIPTNLTATAASATQIDLSWNTSTDTTGVAGYELLRCTGLGCTPNTRVATTAQTSYMNTNLSAATTYTYAVKAYDAAENFSTMSAPVSATTPAPPDTQAPSTPSGLTATTVSASQIDLSWNATSDNIGVIEYHIYRCQGTSCTPSAQIATSSTTTLRNAGLSANTSYRYRVRALDAANNISSYSNVVTGTTQATPSVFNFSLSNDGVKTVTQGGSATSTITATLVSGTAQTVSFTAGGFPSGTSPVFSSSSCTPTCSTALAITAYTTTAPGVYTITATGTAGTLSRTISFSLIVNETPDTQAPSTPENLIATAASATRIDLSWNAATDNTGIAGYAIYRCETVSCTPANLTATSSTPTYHDINLTPATPHTYTVEAYDAANNFSAPSTSVSVTTPAAPDEQTPAPAPTPAPTPVPVPNPAPASGGGGGGALPITILPMTQTSANVNIPPTPPQPTSSPAIPEGSLIRGPDGIKVYIVNGHGYRRHIFNPAVFGMYGHFRWDGIVTVDEQTLDSFAVSDLYRADEDTRVFSLREVDEQLGKAEKQWLQMSPAAFERKGWRWDQVFIINTKERDYYQEGAAITDETGAPVANTSGAAPVALAPLPAGTLAKTADNPAVYYITPQGLKKKIISAAVFNSYAGNKWENIKTVSEGQLARHADVKAIKIQGNPKVYALDGTSKRWVATEAAFTQLGLSWNEVTTVNQTEFSAYTEGSPIE
mgnify:FL=1